MKSFIKLLILLSITMSISTSVFGKTRKAIFIIADGIPADQIERLKPKAIFDIAQKGGYSRAYMGGEIGGYSQTATISAICYTSLITSSWYNKHNVHGNNNLDPNYNYWTIFRTAKEQKREVKTAIYSTWEDNRTVLLGEGLDATNNLVIDYVRDGYELDLENFPKTSDGMQIFNVDEHVSKEAAQSIREDAPDLSWVYLQFTDNAGHSYGNGKKFDDFVYAADKQVERIWDAVKYREKNFNEEWMIVVLTDHGRKNDGYSHGGQLDRERTIWISTNQKTNKYFNTPELAITDIIPSIAEFMRFEIPKEVLWEQDGKSFYGKADIYNMQARPYDNYADIFWDTYNKKAPVNIYVATSNKYKEGEKDEWIFVDQVKAGSKSYRVDLSKYPSSKFYKFVLETPDNHLNRWIIK